MARGAKATRVYLKNYNLISVNYVFDRKLHQNLIILIAGLALQDTKE